MWRKVHIWFIMVHIKKIVSIEDALYKVQNNYYEIKEAMFT